MKYILDIETRYNPDLIDTFSANLKAPANLKDPDKIKKAIKGKKEEAKSIMALDHDYNDIVCIGIKPVGGSARLYHLSDIEEFFRNNQREVETDGNKMIVYDFEFITYNGKSFDIPTLIKAGIRSDLSLPYKKLMDMTKKFKDNGHYDLMEMLSFSEKSKSLDQLLQIYLGISKTPIDFSTATDEEIEEHCLEDLDNEEKLFNKFKEII